MVCSKAVGLSQLSLGWRVGDGRRPSLALLGRTDPGSRMVAQAMLEVCCVVAIGIGRGTMYKTDVYEGFQWVRMV